MSVPPSGTMHALVLWRHYTAPFRKRKGVLQNLSAGCVHFCGLSNITPKKSPDFCTISIHEHISLLNKFTWKIVFLLLYIFLLKSSIYFINRMSYFSFWYKTQAYRWFLFCFCPCMKDSCFGPGKADCRPDKQCPTHYAPEFMWLLQEQLYRSPKERCRIW